MNNPILQALTNAETTRAQTNPTQQDSMSNLKSMIGMLRGSQNPTQMLEGMAMANPQIQQAINYAKQNGGDARTAFYNLAAQKGVDPESILSQLR